MRKLIIFVSLFIFSIWGRSQVIVHFEKGEDSIYKSSFIHNFYNRTSDVVMKVANEFLSDRQELRGEIVNDVENQALKAKLLLTAKLYKKGCITSIDFMTDVIIYYKDNRTKIEFTGFKYQNAVSKCNLASGTLEDLTASDCCKTYELLLRNLAGQTYFISQDYKNYLAKRSRDKKLF